MSSKSAMEHQRKEIGVGMDRYQIVSEKDFYQEKWSKCIIYHYDGGNRNENKNQQ